MRRALAVVLAWLIASLFSVPVALVVVQLAWEIMRVELPSRTTVLIVWMLVAGVPGVSWARQNLANTLRVRPQPVPELRVTGTREISVFADAARWLGRVPSQVLEVPDELQFCYGNVMVTEQEMSSFLVGAWRRQQRGDNPLSRTYWVDQRRMRRSRYDAITKLVEACGLLDGVRKQGLRNRLIGAPMPMLLRLKHRHLKMANMGGHGGIGELGNFGLVCGHIDNSHAGQ